MWQHDVATVQGPVQADCPLPLPCLFLTSSNQHSPVKQKADRKKEIEEVYLADGLQGSSPSWREGCGREADKRRREQEARAKYSPAAYPSDFLPRLDLVGGPGPLFNHHVRNSTKGSSASRSELSESNHQAGDQGPSAQSCYGAFGSTIPPS